uniref:uncharacterized protein LOC129497440 isoform X3 n=1 Tax=Nyctereutes procyonoides TaxID=34880 RepID=UPI0024452C45|nr:uncharacterized protein LOC129497440 isoform X3 [Nyctereutes procyonoides]
MPVKVDWAVWLVRWRSLPLSRSGRMAFPNRRRLLLSHSSTSIPGTPLAAVRSLSRGHPSKVLIPPSTTPEPWISPDAPPATCGFRPLQKAGAVGSGISLPWLVLQRESESRTSWIQAAPQTHALRHPWDREYVASYCSDLLYDS